MQSFPSKNVEKNAYKLLLFPEAAEDPEVLELTVAGLAM